MSIQDKFTFITDDFEVIDKLQKLPPSVISENQQILKHMQDKAYGKDYGAVFGDHHYTYVVYKFGHIEDSGLFMVYVKNEDTIFLKMYLEHGHDVFPNNNIRKTMIETLKTLS